MITVGSRDGRKGLGFGAGIEMEETELEEGEACSYQDEDASIDPDVALSYIDAKLHNVLGHFQKDFEGGVSAENLGAKFGGYGSFLPTYQRSPGWSHPRTPPKIHNYNILGSPKSSQPEGGHHNSVVSTSAHLVRHGPAATNIVNLPATTVPSLHDLSNQDVRMSLVEGFGRRSDIANRSANPPEVSLKVRIKVGSDNLSTQNNAAIYSGLGLGDSPTSSLNDSPTESEGLSCAPDESPNSILQMMTSFPVYGGLLLSPLPDDLILLTKKEKLIRENRRGRVPDGGRGSSVMLVNGSDSVLGEWKVLGQKKTRPAEKSNISLELKNVNSKDFQSGTAVIKRKEADIDTLACEELVSNALKLPLISNSYGTGSNMAKGAVRLSDVSREANKDIVKDNFFSNISKEEHVELIHTQQVGGAENSTGKVASAAKVWEDTKEIFVDDIGVDLRQDGNRKGKNSYDSVKADSNAFKGRKASNSEAIDPLKPKTDQKATSKEQNSLVQPTENEHPSSGGNKKSKGSKSHDALAAEIPKEGSASKSKKSTPAENNFSKSESEKLRLQNDIGKARDRYKDFFGDILLEQEENEADSLEIPSKGKMKDSEVNEKNRFASNNGSRERLSGKMIEKSSATKAYPKAVPNVVPLAGNGPVSDAAPPTVAPIDNNDNWVCCDKCQKWRLLPSATDPNSLPEKWLCSMLNWLDGMNRCSFSEEETTKAVIALNQTLPSQSQNNLQIRLDGIVSGVTPPDVRYPVQNHQHLSFRNVPSEVKKKHETNEIFDTINQGGPAQFPGLMKNSPLSMKSRSLNEVNQSPLVNEIDVQQSRKSSDSAMEKYTNKKKDKNKLLEQYSDGGNTKNLKMKNKRENDQDSFGISKKTKQEGLQYTDDVWMPEHGGAIRKAGPSSTIGLPTDVAGKDQSNYKHGSSSKDSKCDGTDNFKVSIKKLRDQVQVSLDDIPLDLKKCDNIDIVAKKRKVKECEDNQVYSGSLPSTGYHLQDSRVFAKEESSENDHRKEKKTRVPKYGKDLSITSKGNCRSDKRGSTRKDQQVHQDLERDLSQHSFDGMDYSSRDLGSSQPVAATSSSSKVSGSHKSKTNFPEVKGSPVESVSSSPLRILNIDKLALGRMNLVEKDDPREAGLNTGSPRRCSEGEDECGSDRSGTVRKDKSITITQHGSHESSVLDFQDRGFSHLSDSKTKAQVVASSEVMNGHFLNGNVDMLGQYSNKPQASDRCNDEGRRNRNHYHASVSHSTKSGKGSSSRSKDKIWSSKSDHDKHKNTDSFNASQDHTLPYEEKTKDGKSKFQDKCGVDSDKDEMKNAYERDTGVKLSGESSKSENRSRYGGPDVKVQDAIYIPKQKFPRDHGGERSPKIFLSDKTDRAEIISGRGRSVPLQLSGRGQNDTQTHFQRLVPVSLKENGAGILSVDASEGNDALKGSKQNRRAENENGVQQINSRHATPNGQRARDLDAPNPARRDSSTQAATNAVKEAKDLKHLADRLKNSGSNESTGLYFQAAVKFLHGASLFESCNIENSKHADQSMQMYSSTAKLCEFCAHEYERSKDMAAAALAYKCMEVAYMRVIYSSHTSANRDRHELYTALQMVPPGESPSSSASDVDNLNNAATVDKVAIGKGVCSSQVTGNPIIASQNRPSYVRLLNYAQDVNFAMEASRKSRIAFGAANANMEGTQHKEISLIKRALDFNFQDVEGLLRLVKVAVEAISR